MPLPLDRSKNSLFAAVLEIVSARISWQILRDLARGAKGRSITLRFGNCPFFSAEMLTCCRVQRLAVDALSLGNLRGKTLGGGHPFEE